MRLLVAAVLLGVGAAAGDATADLLGAAGTARTAILIVGTTMGILAALAVCLPDRKP